MFYTRRVVSEDTLSSTSAFNRSHSASFSTTIKAFILCPVLGIIGIYVIENITSGPLEHQGETREIEVEQPALLARRKDHLCPHNNSPTRPPISRT